MTSQTKFFLNPFASLLITALILVSFIVFSGVRAAETDVSKEVKEAGSAIADYSVEQKDAAVQKAKEMLDTTDRHIRELEKKLENNWDDMKEGAREKYKTNLGAMREKHKDLSNRYESLKDSSGDAWHEVKTGFTESYHSLAQHMKEAKDEMTKE